MQTGFFGTLFVPHMTGKNMSREVYVCTSTQFPSDDKKLPPALDSLLSPAFSWL